MRETFLYVEDLSATMDGARMKRMLFVGSSSIRFFLVKSKIRKHDCIKIHKYLSPFTSFFSSHKTDELAHFGPEQSLLYSIFFAGLLDTAEGVPQQTQDLELLLEETLAWTMSNVR